MRSRDPGRAGQYSERAPVFRIEFGAIGQGFAPDASKRFRRGAIQPSEFELNPHMKSLVHEQLHTSTLKAKRELVVAEIVRQPAGVEPARAYEGGGAHQETARGEAVDTLSWLGGTKIEPREVG